MNLTEKKCVPCEGGVPPIKGDDIYTYLKEVDGMWEQIDETKIKCQFLFDDFVQTMAFVNQVADLAEKENHHPDMHVYYGRVVVELWTHSIGGLSENDFILAAKIEKFNKN
ncbi:MAG: 4a-hydroxytetrahydrobiopterin dehydratase [Bacteroidetes bacterium]|nr:4a-hydroxytetrahydrobiopterin dehydratase [Bacteroidota bacterium]